MTGAVRPGIPLAEMLLPITGRATGKNHTFSKNSINADFNTRIMPVTTKASFTKTDAFFG